MRGIVDVYILEKILSIIDKKPRKNHFKMIFPWFFIYSYAIIISNK